MPETDAGSLVIEYLASRDAACPVCAYNVRGSSGACCSECGAKLALCVASDHVRTGPWALMMVSAALPLGFGAAFLTMSIIMQIAGRGSFERNLQAIAISGAMAAGFAIALGAVVALRRRLWRASPRRQWSIAGGVACVCAIAFFIGFTAVIGVV